MKRRRLFLILGGLALGFGLFVFVAKKTSVTVTVERVFAAPPAKVWQLWTDVESIKKWWSPKGFTAPVIQSDFREGGAYLFSMRDPGGKMFWNVGRYVEIVPQQRIVSKLSFSDESGKVVPASQYGVPGDWPDEVTVTVEFKEIEGKTHVRITEAGIPAIMYVFAKMGWAQQFEKFDGLL